MPRVQLRHEDPREAAHARAILLPRCFGDLRIESGDDLFQDRPTIVVEVLSQKLAESTEGEKKDAYLTIPSLFAYL